METQSPTTAALILTVLVAVVVVPVAVFEVVTARPKGALGRYGLLVCRIYLLSLLTVGFWSWPPYSSVTLANLFGPTRVLIATQLAITVIAVLALVWKRRRPDPPPVKTSLPWLGYAGVAALFVSFHTGLAYVLKSAPPPSPGIYPTGTYEWFVAIATPWAAIFMVSQLSIFMVSQLSTSALLSSLHAALQQDWEIAPGNPRRRTYLFLLAGIPIAACIFPSIMYGALLAGVLFRLAVMLAWWCLDPTPSGDDRDQLPPSSLIKTLRALTPRVARRAMPRPM